MSDKEAFYVFQGPLRGKVIHLGLDQPVFLVGPIPHFKVRYVCVLIDNYGNSYIATLLCGNPYSEKLPSRIPFTLSLPFTIEPHTVDYIPIELPSFVTELTLDEGQYHKAKRVHYENY